GEHAFARGLRVVHPVERKDEQRGRDEIANFFEAFHQRLPPSPGDLNIFSIRSVIKKPLMILVIEAKSAIAPMMRIGIGWPSPPTTMIEPTTAIAEIALVSDMSGVCSSRDTRRITPRPMNVASMKTNRSEE